jgi:DNA-binding transcriptional ArsR family regulator
MTYERALDALGDPTRRAIVERLRRSPAAVGEIAAELPVSRPAVSQHLRVLEGAGLVSHEPVGTRHIYKVETTGLNELRAYIDRLWDESLARFKQIAENEEREER